MIAAGATAPEILGKAAQAEFLSADRVLSQQARSRAEQALALDPAESAALATLGMAAFEEADYREAITYWQRLRVLEAPGSPGHAMLGQVIARAEQELAKAGGWHRRPDGRLAVPNASRTRRYIGASDAANRTERADR